MKGGLQAGSAGLVLKPPESATCDFNCTKALLGERPYKYRYKFDKTPQTRAAVCMYSRIQQWFMPWNSWQSTSKQTLPWFRCTAGNTSLHCSSRESWSAVLRGAGGMRRNALCHTQHRTRWEGRGIRVRVESEMTCLSVLNIRVNCEAWWEGWKRAMSKYSSQKMLPYSCTSNEEWRNRNHTVQVQCSTPPCNCGSEFTVSVVCGFFLAPN